MNKSLSWIIGVALVVVIAIFLGRTTSNPVSQGSVSQGSEYNATSTYRANGVPQFPNTQVIKTFAGTLGSVVITGAVAGTIRLYDATSTTDVSSTTLAIFPSSTAAGTYTFDVGFSRGLIVGTTVGLAPTTTITWR